jgi:hypothetical protein
MAIAIPFLMPLRIVEGARNPVSSRYRVSNYSVSQSGEVGAQGLAPLLYLIGLGIAIYKLNKLELVVTEIPCFKRLLLQ